MRNLPDALRVKMLQSTPHLRHPKMLGRALNPEYSQHIRHIPILMHGKRVVFGQHVSSKNKIKTPKAFYPNVVNVFLYSRLLDMNVLCKASTEAVRQVESAGGFDEYLLTVADKLISHPVAVMYRQRIAEAWRKNQGMIKKREMEMLGNAHGTLYKESLKRALFLFENAQITINKNHSGKKVPLT